MFFRLASFPSLNSLKLRPKLILAFAAISMMAGLCGSVGLFFVDRISASVGVFSDVTSPLQVESMALVENARRMRTTLFRALDAGETGDQLSHSLLDLHAESQGHLAALRRLAERTSVDIKVDAAEQREREFVQVLERMMAASGREQTASAITKDRLAQFDAKHRAVTGILLALANRAEGELNRAEDQAKVQVQTGAATVDGLGELISGALTNIYPVVQNANKLMRETEQIDEAAHLLLAQTDQMRVAEIERDAQDSFKMIVTLSKKLAGRLRDADGKAELAKIQQGFADLEASVLGPQGLFGSVREALEARAEVTTGRASIEEIDRAYLGILDQVERAVAGLNRDARQQAANSITQARTMIAAIIVLTVLAGLTLAVLLARRIAGPLTRLADHVVDIRKSGKLDTRIDPSVTDRGDEIGTLSRAFNLMIAELADARRRLIAWSEAEILKQYGRLDAAISNMPIGLCMFDAEQKLIISNARYVEFYGIAPEYTVPGTPFRTILEHTAPGHATAAGVRNFIEERLAVLTTGEPVYFTNEMSDGRVIAVSYRPTPNGGMVGTHEDITERRKSEAKIAYMAHHDALTELPNRVRFRSELEKALGRTDRGETVAVHCIDLDHFKAVNDTLGHPVGDALLQAVAVRIRDCLRPTDTVARLGGDEFAIVQVSADQPIGSTALATRIIKAVGEPFDIRGHQVVIGASVGIALAPHDGVDPDRLLKNADMALYRAKEDGRGIYRFFESEMDAKMQARRTLELDLRKAVALGEFELFYQPLINLSDDEVSGFEALMRWRHPQRGLVPPNDFIPLAEDIGLIAPMGAWALKQACTEAMNWPDHVKIAVNLSPIQFKGGNLVLDVIAALGQSGLPARRLELEITETVLLQDTDGTIAILNQLRELGVHISMDDFGTGYSSLGYLRKFPFDKIKIDRSFIHDMSERPDSMAIVRAVAGLGSSLGISTTAEGVETEEQMQQLRDEGCTEVQGFLISEPRPASELGALLKRLAPAERTAA